MVSILKFFPRGHSISTEKSKHMFCCFVFYLCPVIRILSAQSDHVPVGKATSSRGVFLQRKHFEPVDTKAVFCVV